MGLFAASCLPMLAMLPAGLTGVLATVGISADAGVLEAVSAPLEPIARPLLVVSTLVLAAGCLACGRAPVATAIAGGALLYLGMYVVTEPTGQTQGSLFYPGLALFLAAPTLSFLRPRLHACRPLLPAAMTHKVLAGVAAGGGLLLATAPILGWGEAAATVHGEHAGGMQATTRSASAVRGPRVRIAPDAFAWSGRVAGHTNDDAWFPAISTNGARLRIRGRRSAGSLYVQVMDARAVTVYERTLGEIPPRGISQPLPGMAGSWMVTLGFRGFSGKLDVELRSLRPR